MSGLEARGRGPQPRPTEQPGLSLQPLTGLPGSSESPVLAGQVHRTVRTPVTCPGVKEWLQHWRRRVWATPRERPDTLKWQQRPCPPFTVAENQPPLPLCLPLGQQVTVQVEKPRPRVRSGLSKVTEPGNVRHQEGLSWNRPLHAVGDNRIPWCRHHPSQPPCHLGAVGTCVLPSQGQSCWAHRHMLLVWNAEVVFKHFSGFMRWHLPASRPPTAPGHTAEA